jgi:hypothetical protein
MLVKLPPVIVKLEEPVKNDMKLVTCDLKRIWTQQKCEGEKEQ